MSGIAGVVWGRMTGPEALAGKVILSLKSEFDEVEVWAEPGAFLGCAHLKTKTGAALLAESGNGERRIAFCGYLLNRRELEAGLEGEVPPNQSDAATVLRLFEQRGEAALPMLDGSFAFAIYDRRNHELMIANDRFSSRPIYWAELAGGGIAFGTQVHSVLQVPGVSLKLDMLSVRELLHYQRVHGTRTLNSAVAMIAPGTSLRLRDGRPSFNRWFEMAYRPERLSTDEWVEVVAGVFQRSVRASCQGVERVGVMLSGGLDSRMIVAASESPLACFHFNDHRNRECETARRIAAVRGFEFFYLQRPADHYARIMERAVDIGDGLFGFVHGHPIGLVPTGLVDAMTHGFAPELFFRGTNLPQVKRRPLGSRATIGVLDTTLTSRNVPERIRTGLKYTHFSAGRSHYFRRELRADFDQLLLETASGMVGEAQQHSGDPYDWFTWADTRYHCKYPSFLFERAVRQEQDERSIVFKNEVLDLHLRMPVSARSDSEIWNRAVRSLNPAVARVTDANTGHPPMRSYVGKLIFDLAGSVRRRASGRVLARKVEGSSDGSWPDFRALIVQQKDLCRSIRQTISDTEALSPEIFDLGQVEKAFADHLEGRRNEAELLFLLVTFGCWHKKYGPPARGLSRGTA